MRASSGFRLAAGAGSQAHVTLLAWLLVVDARPGIRRGTGRLSQPRLRRDGLSLLHGAGVRGQAALGLLQDWGRPLPAR